MVTETMTIPERAVYGALTKLGIDFTTQVSMMGGRQERGGAVIDFQIPSLALIIRVVGTYWHSSSEAQSRDMLQKIALESSGWRVIDISDTNALANARFYVEDALRFISH